MAGDRGGEAALGAAVIGGASGYRLFFSGPYWAFLSLFEGLPIGYLVVINYC